MKLVVAGSTGFLGTEVVRQALAHPAVTSVIGLARRPTPVPENTAPSADTSKLKSVVCEDMGAAYPDSVKQELVSADACIWCIAITPNKARTIPWEEVRRVSYDYTITGLKTLAQVAGSSPQKPLRFIYVSGSNSERDQTKRPWLLADLCLMRGAVETRVIEYANNSQGSIQACVAKSGLIGAPNRSIFTSIARTIFCTAIGLPRVELGEISATLIDQAVNGIQKETLLNEDLVNIGGKILAEQQTKP